MSSGSRFRRVTFHAEGCHLCERAIEVAHDARARMPLTSSSSTSVVSQTLESAYREFLPVIEIDGVRAFTYFVTVDALLERLGGRRFTRRADSPRRGNM